MNDTFCGHCGADLAAHEQTLRARVEQQLIEIQQQVEQGALNDAVLALRTLAPQLTHPCLETQQRQVQRLIANTSAERDRAMSAAESALERANHLLAAADFAGATKQLETIPEPMRDDTARQLLTTARLKAQEAADLAAQLCRGDGINTMQRLAALRRLLELKPNSAQVRKWAVQLRTHALKSAVRLLQKQRYDEALALVNEIPKEIENSVTISLRQKAAELAYLAAELVCAPEVVETTIQAARRLVQLDPKNQAAQTTLQKLLDRMKEHAVKTPSQPVPWSGGPRQAFVGCPVELISLPPVTRFTSADAKHEFAAAPHRFTVACGLALQGIGRSHIATNLLPTGGAATRVMSLLRRPVLARSVESAWGIAGTALGIAAIRLVLKDDQPAIDQCIYVAHSKPLNHPSADSGADAAMLQSLTTAAAQLQPADDEPVVAQVNIARTLVRHLRLPNTQENKRRELIRYEAKHQIPYPLDRVAFDAHVFQTDDISRPSGQQQVLLIAATLEEVERQQALYASAGFKLHCIQNDCVAIHNWMHHEYLATDRAIASDQQRRSVATLDVGLEAARLVFSTPRSLWFRAIPASGDDMVRGLIDGFQLTYDVAFRVLQAPYQARRMSDVHEQNCQLFRSLVDHIRRSLKDARESYADIEPSVQCVSGELGRTPGLVRFLRHGR